MEQRSSYVLVGAFVLAFVFSIVFVFVWMEKHSSSVAYKYYKIYTKDSVAGLNAKAAVKFNGLNVGEVVKLEINSDNTEEVSVVIMVIEDTPIKEDTVASIDSQGITGLSYIQLSGGTKEAKLLKTSDNEYGIIHTTPSMLAKIDKSMSAILDSTEKTIIQIGKIASDENVENLAEILENLSSTTKSFSILSKNFEQKLSKIDSMLDGIIAFEKSASQAIEDIGDMTSSVKDVVNNINSKIDDGEFDINSAINKNLESTQKTVSELNLFMQQLRQGLESIKKSPSDIFFKSGMVEPGPGEEK